MVVNDALYNSVSLHDWKTEYQNKKNDYEESQDFILWLVEEYINDGSTVQELREKCDKHDEQK